MASDDKPDNPFGEPIMQIGRYAVFEEIARGGFASVHLGRVLGAGGFARTVAIKRLHRQFAKDPEVSAMFLDEARVVARIRHPNVVPTLDLITEDDELFLVMEYVEGVTFRQLMVAARKRKKRVPLGVSLAIICGALRGLHAAHQAQNERGELLNLVHRDVTPDNIHVGIDGLPRLLDFGVARALGQYHNTREGEVKGKVSYLTPEQVAGNKLTALTDVFSAGSVLWEAMTGKQLFKGASIAATTHKLMNDPIRPPSEVADTPKKLDGIVLQALERDPGKRWSSAERMASALEAVGEPASPQVVGQYVKRAGATWLKARAEEVKLVEGASLDPGRFQSKDEESALSKRTQDLLSSRVEKPAAPETPKGVPPPPPIRSRPPPPPKRAAAIEAIPSPANKDEPSTVNEATPNAVTTESSSRFLPALTPAIDKRKRLLIPAAVGGAALVLILLVALSGGDDDGQGAEGQQPTSTMSAEPPPSGAIPEAKPAPDPTVETAADAGAPEPTPSASTSAEPEDDADAGADADAETDEDAGAPKPSSSFRIPWKPPGGSLKPPKDLYGRE